MRGNGQRICYYKKGVPVNPVFPTLMNSLMCTLAHLEWDILSPKDKTKLKHANI
jgi:hypothetical protein